MDYTVKGKDILVKQADLSLDETLDCGQAFRWTKIEGGYTGHFLNRPLTILDEDPADGVFRFCGVSESELLEVWQSYFDFATDYGELKRRFSEDETLAKACKFAGGIRILRQDSWEALSSFIISQNNNIPRIKGIIGRLCEQFGGYPSAEEMAAATAEGCESLAGLRAGFRAKYLADAAQKVAGGEIDLAQVAKMDADSARAELMKIKGVGPKVADCTMLFGMYKLEAFPKDVWVKRVIAEWYPNGLPECIKGAEGAAQQYLFHYIRSIER